MSSWTLFGDQALAEALGWTVLHSLWQGALLIALLALAACNGGDPAPLPTFMIEFLKQIFSL